MLAVNQHSSSDAEHMPSLMIGVSMALAFLLAIWPLPAELKWYRPEFGLLVLFFWMRLWSFRLGLVFAWISGLLFDLLRGDVACQSALGLTLVAYLVLVFHAVIVRATLLTEIFIVAALTLVYLLAGFWVMAVAGEMVWRFENFYMVLTTAFCWPLVKWLLQKFFVRH